MTAAPEDPSPAEGRRQRLLWLLALVTMAGLAAWAAYHFLHGRYHERTDDAYVAGHLVPVTAQVAGTVTAVLAMDGDFVRAGTPLVQLDESDARLALEAAEAELARAVRDVRARLATGASIGALAEQRRVALERAQEDLRRRQLLAHSGALPREDLAHAQSGVAAAAAALREAEEQLHANAVQVVGTVVGNHPAVAAAATRVREAFLQRRRTAVPAPLSGHVARRAVHPGQRVAPGTPLLTVVALDSVWVDANFKEVQLRRMRPGQAATLTADVYGRAVEYRGRVAGIGAGTGAAFAVLPPQNATGNWIKLVQRVSVRITLEPDGLAAHPLRIGLSMAVDVDTESPPVAAPAAAPAAVPAVSEDNARVLAAAEARILAIVAANMAPVAGR
jgi:membrane fusion protein (multidrug efflux system)